MVTQSKLTHESHARASSESSDNKKEQPASTLASWNRMAHLMDNAFRIPGTSFRFGLDPIIGLIPGVGDAIAGLISSMMLLQARESKLPKIVQARMATNIFLNTAIGAIPGIGDLFSLWFKSNARNYEMLQRYQSPDDALGKKTTRDSWWFVGGLLFAILAFTTLTFVAVFGLISMLFGM